MHGGITEGRAAFAQQRWRDAYTNLSDAMAELTIETEDIERSATAAYLIGLADESVAHWTRSSGSV
jgi:hypothetical protein